ncbi:hypothetical protein F2Q69_00014302 [Brassica cretica]|uniref:Uncharacterized protein n=1 Tax=Brassica cretica TaxID=69181 RepID=A0A8S9R670_BRACR|nr:hypothetical protein F2Q69_00014302 [Brassica cretica]
MLTGSGSTLGCEPWGPIVMLTGSTPGCGELPIPVTHTDMSLRFRAHLNTRREDLSVGCTSPWGLVWASPWIRDTPG